MIKFFKDDPLSALIVSLLVLLLVVSVPLLICSGVKDSEKKDTCESKGGFYYQPYKSSGICLKSGDVIK